MGHIKGVLMSQCSGDCEPVGGSWWLSDGWGCDGMADSVTKWGYLSEGWLSSPLNVRLKF